MVSERQSPRALISSNGTPDWYLKVPGIRVGVDAERGEVIPKLCDENVISKNMWGGREIVYPVEGLAAWDERNKTECMPDSCDRA